MGQRSMERGAAFAQLLDAGDRERAASAETLHAGVLQSLAAAAMNLSALDGHEHARTQAALTDCVRLIGEAIEAARALSYCADPPFVAELGFHAALHAYAAAFQRVRRRPFSVVVAPGCTALNDDLARAFARGIRDASEAFAEAGASTLIASAAERDETVSACVEARFDGCAALPEFGLLAAIATERMRAFRGEAKVEIAAGVARLHMRASARRPD